MLHKTDKEILLLVAESDRDAFAELYSRFWHTIYATACRYLLSAEQAQDIVQDIFVKIWVKRNDLKHVDRIDDFIFIIARNEIISAFRRKHHIAAQLSVKDEICINRIPDTDNKLLLNETRRLVNLAIEQLPPQQKMVFRLTREEGLSHARIATIMGINVRTVNNHITRALANIQRFLEEKNEIRLIHLFFFCYTVHSAFLIRL
ncbi:MAG: RNA polymerase sigma-70 factor [Agriterribacter sp.]